MKEKSSSVQQMLAKESQTWIYLELNSFKRKIMKILWFKLGRWILSFYLEQKVLFNQSWKVASG